MVFFNLLEALRVWICLDEWIKLVIKSPTDKDSGLISVQESKTFTLNIQRQIMVTWIESLGEKFAPKVLVGYGGDFIEGLKRGIERTRNT